MTAEHAHARAEQARQALELLKTIDDTLRDLPRFDAGDLFTDALLDALRAVDQMSVLAWALIGRAAGAPPPPPLPFALIDPVGIHPEPTAPARRIVQAGDELPEGRWRLVHPKEA